MGNHDAFRRLTTRNMILRRAENREQTLSEWFFGEILRWHPRNLDACKMSCRSTLSRISMLRDGAARPQCRAQKNCIHCGLGGRSRALGFRRPKRIKMAQQIAEPATEGPQRDPPTGVSRCAILFQLPLDGSVLVAIHVLLTSSLPSR